MILSPALRRSVLPVFTPLLGAGMFLLPFASSAAGEKIEKHFTVKGHPVVMIQNVADGRIEVKSSKNSEVVVSASGSSNKIGIEMEQADERLEFTANPLENPAPALDLAQHRHLTLAQARDPCPNP